MSLIANHSHALSFVWPVVIPAICAIIATIFA